MRNLHDFGETEYRSIDNRNAIPVATDDFLKLFPESRQDKAEFMTAEMRTFFQSLSISLADSGIIKFGVLEAGDKPLAMVMYFDYNNNIYLYNSSYNPEYKSLSVGLISKAGCIQDNIQRGKENSIF
jgi:CelD/BcsL family acetyltransferase involved in cellulose biosynthesis